MIAIIEMRNIKNSFINIYYMPICQVLRINQSDENPSAHGAYSLVARNGQQTKYIKYTVCQIVINYSGEAASRKGG